MYSPHSMPRGGVELSGADADSHCGARPLDARLVMQRGLIADRCINAPLVWAGEVL